MATSKAKIFGIGLSKTGTTSLANALQILGYKTKDNMGVVKYATGDLSSVDLNVVNAHNALTDTPIPSFYRELDAAYPGSQFILTVRDNEEWLKSCRKQFTQRDAERQNEAHKRLFIDLYGTDVFDAQGFGNGYRRFVDGVRDYFKDRPQDLLIFDISGGEGWEKLCTFLDRPLPDIPFPKANVTQVRWMNIDDVIAVARRGGAELMRRFERRHGMDAHGDNREPSRARGARRFVEAAMRTFRPDDAVQVAIRRAHNVIAAGLIKLHPRIAVVSRASDLAAYLERRRWNHYWLVDPLDGEGAFVRGSDTFSVNIALIEDGWPIYGVVYAPAMDMTYYGRAGKGSYRRTDGEEPVPLARGRSSRQPALTFGPSRGQPDSAERQGKTSSHALAICKLAEGEGSDDWVLQPSMQWRTAAAHAILRSAGMRICDAESGEELSYNKEDFATGPVKIA
jgi:3'-phosphoadenosine 5'-phosphosulfate (PAPS) 3'-phosphatase